MAKRSLLSGKRQCYICAEINCIKNTKNLERHHVFPGSRREASEATGCFCWLCQEHHTGPTGVHHNRTLAMWLMARCQRNYEAKFGHDKFMAFFGKNFAGESPNTLEREDFV